MKFMYNDPDCIKDSTFIILNITNCTINVYMNRVDKLHRIDISFKDYRDRIFFLKYKTIFNTMDEAIEKANLLLDDKTLFTEKDFDIFEE